MNDTPELRLELLKIASKVAGSRTALMKVAEELRAYVLAPGVSDPTTEDTADLFELVRREA